MLWGRTAASPRWRGASNPQTEAEDERAARFNPTDCFGFLERGGAFPRPTLFSLPVSHRPDHPPTPSPPTWFPRARTLNPGGTDQSAQPALLPHQPSACTWRRDSGTPLPGPDTESSSLAGRPAHLEGTRVSQSLTARGSGGKRVPISAQARQEGGRAPPTPGPAPTGARGQLPARPPPRRGRQETRSPLWASPRTPPSRSQRPDPWGLTASPGTCNSSGLRRHHRPSARVSMRPTGPSPRDDLSSPPEAGRPAHAAGSAPPTSTCPEGANEKWGRGSAGPLESRRAVASGRSSGDQSLRD